MILGSGIIKFETGKEASLSIECMNGGQIDGLEVVVEFFKETPQIESTFSKRTQIQPTFPKRTPDIIKKYKYNDESHGNNRYCASRRQRFNGNDAIDTERRPGDPYNTRYYH